MEELGPRLRRLRKERGWSLEKLAEEASFDGMTIHYTTIGKIERGQRKPSGELLIHLAVALDCSINQLTHQYPEYYNETFTAVISWESIDNWEEASAASREFVMSVEHHGKAFALPLLAGKADRVIQGDRGFAVVNPQENELTDGRVYLVSEAHADPSFQRYHSNPPRLEALGLGTEGHSTPIGRSPFTVVGRVIWLGISI